MMAKNGMEKGMNDVRKRKRKRKGKEKSDGFHLASSKQMGSIFSRRLQRLWLFPTFHCYYYHTMPIHAFSSYKIMHIKTFLFFLLLYFLFFTPSSRILITIVMLEIIRIKVRVFKCRWFL